MPSFAHLGIMKGSLVIFIHSYTKKHLIFLNLKEPLVSDSLEPLNPISRGETQLCAGRLRFKGVFNASSLFSSAEDMPWYAVSRCMAAPDALRRRATLTVPS